MFILVACASSDDTERDRVTETKKYRRRLKRSLSNAPSVTLRNNNKMIPKDVFFLEEEVTILFTSDIHGHALPINYSTNEPENIGVVKYATAVKQMKKEKSNLLLIDNGDLIQGTPLMTNYIKNHVKKENPMIGMMNLLEIDVGVLGNHEFNFGQEVINSAVKQARFPILSANILDERTGDSAFGPAYTVKEFQNGLRVAIIGVTTHYIPNWELRDHITGLEFRDAFETLQEWVPYVKQNESPDIIIVSYHGGFEADLETGTPTEALTGENQGYQICLEIPGIDVLLTGHQHRKLTTLVNGVLVVQPGKNGSHYGELNLTLEKNTAGKWNLIHKEATLHALDTIESDSELLTYITPLEKSTQAWLDNPVGWIKGEMTIKNPFEVRIKKHPFIQLIQDIQLEASGADISVTSLLNNDSTGFHSTVTMRDIISNYMYPSTLVVLELSGQVIKAAIEQSAQYFILDERGKITINPAYLKPKAQHYNYDMWEGINYTLNISKPFGSRIEEITYKNKPLLDEDTYHVVVTNYRASGGGNFEMFLGSKVIREIQKDPVDLIQSYFEEHPTIEAYTINNFHITK